MSKAYTGAALCCGEIPNYESKINTFKCLKCAKTIGAWNGDYQFHLQHWNRLFQRIEEQPPKTVVENIVIDAPKDYIWSTLNIERIWMGGKAEHTFDAVLLHVKKKRIIIPFMKDCILRNISYSFPTNVDLHMSSSWCTDKSQWHRCWIVIKPRQYNDFFKKTGIEISESW